MFVVQLWHILGNVCCWVNWDVKWAVCWWALAELEASTRVKACTDVREFTKCFVLYNNNMFKLDVESSLSV